MNYLSSNSRIINTKGSNLYFHCQWMFIIILMITNIHNAKSQVYNHPTYARKSDNEIEIIRIQITNKYTIVELVHTNPFFSGGWANITPTAFIRLPKIGKQLKLIKATGIPIRPKQYNYKKQGEKLYFRLYFPPVNPSTEYLDIIELEGADMNKAFNFYRVKLVPIV